MFNAEHWGLGNHTEYSLKCKQSLTSLRLFPEILEINIGPFLLQTQLYGTTGLQKVTAYVKSERFITL